MKINLVIAEDDAIARGGIRTELNDSPTIHIVHETSSGQRLIEMDLSKIDLVLLDLGLADINGTLALKSLKHDWPLLKVLILTTHLENHLLARVIRHKADGYLLKEEVPLGHLQEAIKAVMEGRSYFSPKVGLKTHSLMQLGEVGTGPVNLNDVGSVLWATAYYTFKRLSRDQIAKRMNLSANSVRNNKVRLADKLGLKGSSEKELRSVLEGNQAFWILMMDSLAELKLPEVD